MSAGYLLAAIPEPFTILGQRLKPFCLGHELLFQRFGVRFSTQSDQEPEYSDLILAVFICAHNYESALKAIESRWLWLKLKFWGWSCGRFDVGEKMKLFRDYVAANTSQPEYTTDRDGGAASGAPVVQSLKVYLMEHCGMSPSEAMNSSFSMALWDYLTSQDSKGAIHIVTDEDRENRKFAEAMSAKADAWAAGLTKD